MTSILSSDLQKLRSSLKEWIELNSSKLLIWAGRAFEKSAKLCLFFFVSAYRTIGTSHLGGACRFYPSCSEYGIEVIEKHNVIVATRLILGRVCRCHPFGGSGFDPVPDAKSTLSHFWEYGDSTKG
ncbi:MAG: membrane protein insertion efficiency factor YidD [Pseudobdellovibrionaceae bacterium]